MTAKNRGQKCVTRQRSWIEAVVSWGFNVEANRCRFADFYTPTRNGLEYAFPRLQCYKRRK